MLMYFGRKVNWKQWGSERLVLTFWNINETGKCPSLKRTRTHFGINTQIEITGINVAKHGELCNLFSLIILDIYGTLNQQTIRDARLSSENMQFSILCRKFHLEINQKL